jgi:hypothetical protein
VLFFVKKGRVMKAFINDWMAIPETYDENNKENREYPINEWITEADGSRSFLVSAYVYDDFIMFLFMGEPAYSLNYNSFEYEVNHLKMISAKGSQPIKHPDVNQPEWAHFHPEALRVLNDEFKYLYDLMHEAGRIPDDLKEKKFTFYKYSISFEAPVEEIHHLAIYPMTFHGNNYYIGKTFSVPYGPCTLEIPYTVSPGQESFIIIKELKFYDLMEEYEKSYDEIKKTYDESQLDWEKNEERYKRLGMGRGRFEEIKEVYDMTVLQLSLLCPEEKRTFSFRADTGYIRPQEKDVITHRVFFYTPSENEDRKEGDLYRYTAILGEVGGEPKKSYEVTLEGAADPYIPEREVIWEKNFSKLPDGRGAQRQSPRKSE